MTEESYGLRPDKRQERRDIERDATTLEDLGYNQDRRKGNLSSGDLAEKPLTLTMKKFKFIKFPGDREDKLKIYFEEFDKPYISNKTNVDLLARMMQSSSFEDWTGQKVVFYYDPGITMEDEITGGIRVCEEGALPKHVVAYYDAIKEGAPQGTGVELGEERVATDVQGLEES